MPGPLGKLQVVLGLDAREFMGGIQSVQGTVSRLSQNAQVMGAAIGAGLGTGAVAALKLADSYDSAVDSIRSGTGATGEELAGLESQFKSVSGRVTDDIGLVAKVLADLNTRTGQTGDGLGKLAESVLDVSNITGTEAVTNVALLTRAYGDWSIATEDQIATNDKLLRAAQATGISFASLTETVVQFGAPMRALGFTFEEGISLLGKWEKEGVNIETVLAGLRMAVANFAKQGIDPREGLPALIDNILSLDDAQGLLAAKQIVGQRAANDFFRAVKEGRFDIDSVMAAVNDGSDTVQGLSDELRDAGDGFLEFRNMVATTIGPIVKDFAGMTEAFGNSIYLLPVLGGALGKGLGALWQRAGASAAVKGAIATAGAGAGLIYEGAALVASRFIGAASALWMALGSPGSAVVARAMAAGAAAGAAYAGAAGAGGFLGAVGSAVAAMAPLAIPAVIAVGAKPVIDQVVNSLDISQQSKDMATGAGIMSAIDKANQRAGGEWRWPWEQGGFFNQTEASLYDPLSSVLQSAVQRSVDDAVKVGASLGEAFAAGAARTNEYIQGIITNPIVTEFANARKAILSGFGSIKSALAKGSRPQLISRDDRISNMEKRQGRINKQLNRAVEADDPFNVRYWAAAAAKQQVQLDRLRGKTGSDLKDVKSKYRDAGIDIGATWDRTQRVISRESRTAADAAISEAQRTASTMAALDFAAIGSNWMLSLAAGITANIGAVSSAAAAAATAAQAASAGAKAAASVAPRPEGGGTTVVVSGNVYGGPAGLDQLGREIDRRKNARSRGPMRYQQTD